MSGFLYFVPGHRLTRREELADVGLDRVIDLPSFANISANGPGGSGGTLIVDKSSGDAVPLVKLEHQVWDKVVDRDSGDPRFWVGYFREERPTQDSLVRKFVLPGAPLKMLDGNEWTIPILREWNLTDDETEIIAGTPLPRMIGCDAAGRVCKGDVRPEYRGIWQRSWEFHVSVFSQMTSEDIDVEVPLVDMYELAVDILNLNYRVLGPELRALDVMSTEEAHQIIRKALDWEGYLHSAKNLLGRLDESDTTSPSGSKRPTEDEATSTPTAQQSAN